MSTANCFINRSQLEKLKRTADAAAAALGTSYTINDERDFKAERAPQVFESLSFAIRTRFTVDEMRLLQIREQLEEIQKLHWYERDNKKHQIRAVFSHRDPGIGLVDSFEEFLKNDVGAASSFERLDTAQQEQIRELFVAERSAFMNRLYPRVALAQEQFLTYARYNTIGGELSESQYNRFLGIREPSLDELDTFYRTTMTAADDLSLVMPKDNDAFWIALWKIDQLDLGRGLLYNIIEARAAIGMTTD